MSSFTSGRLWAVCCLLCGVGCASGGPIGFLNRTSPYDTYAAQLEQAGLAATALGRDWTAAGARALATPAVVAPPFMEAGYFAADAPAALAYRLPLTRGRRLVVDVAIESLQPTRVFVDLFAVRDGAPPERVASLEDGASTLTYAVARDGDYLVRVQPELLRDVRTTLTQRTEATLRFPLDGLTATAVQSGFGAVRDGGRRDHEGIDIFAPRGTPVAAVADGVARADTNGLGGNVVWLRGNGRTFYYAHLDRQAIEGTVRVRAGDVLGYVGNTGNARTTAPHLHFGIYDGDAIDPLPFVQPDDPAPPPPAPAADRLGLRLRVARPRTSLREGPAPRAAAILELERATIGTSVGLAQRAVRLVLPDGTSGYVDDAAVVPAEASALRRMRLAPGTVIQAAPVAAAPVVVRLDEAAQADVLGEFDGYLLLRVDGRPTGWATP